MSWFWVVLATVALQLVLTEALDWCPWLAGRLIRGAAHRLPRADRARYEEEWLAELDALPGRRISKLIFAASILGAAHRTRRELSTTTKASSTLTRSIDVYSGVTLLVLVAPLLAMIAVMVRLASPGPMLIGQRELGRDGKPFTMYRFRTTSSFGHLLRRTALDELPAIYNLLRGDISLGSLVRRLANPR